MTEKGREPGDDIRRALQILDAADTAADNDRAVEAAFRTLARLLPSSLPRPDFSRRVIAAVHQVSLPAGRRKLRARRPVIITGFTGAAAAAGLCAILWITGFVQPLVARTFLLIVQGGFLAIRSVSFMLDVWKWMDHAGRVFTAVLTSPEMLNVVAAAAFLSVLSLAALTRLVKGSS